MIGRKDYSLDSGSEAGMTEGKFRMTGETNQV